METGMFDMTDSQEKDGVREENNRYHQYAVGGLIFMTGHEKPNCLVQAMAGS
jgi:hypothetical protein